MIEKIKRKKQTNKQEMTEPKSVKDLMQKYDLANTDIYDFLDYLVDYLNKKGV